MSCVTTLIILWWNEGNTYYLYYTILYYTRMVSFGHNEQQRVWRREGEAFKLRLVGLFWCQWIRWSKESKQNNEEGGFSPNSSGKPKIISQKIESWVQLEVPRGRWSQEHVRSGKGMAESGQNWDTSWNLSCHLVWNILHFLTVVFILHFLRSRYLTLICGLAGLECRTAAVVVDVVFFLLNWASDVCFDLINCCQVKARWCSFRLYCMEKKVFTDVFSLCFLVCIYWDVQSKAYLWCCIKTLCDPSMVLLNEWMNSFDIHLFPHFVFVLWLSRL